jgi:hypothetical protein
VLELRLLAPGVEACMPGAGFWYLKLIPEPLPADVSADFTSGALFAGPAFPLFGISALMGCRSSRVSSASGFPPLVAFGAAEDDLR